MASVFKRRRRLPIPEGATLKNFRSTPVAEWTDTRGNRQRAPLADDGGAIMAEAEHYTVKYFDHEGKRRTKGTRIADMDGAKQYAAELEKRASLRREGIIDARQERLSTEGRRGLAEQLADFQAKMAAAGRDPKHVTTTVNYIRKVAKAAGFDTLSSITTDGVTPTLKTLASDIRRGRFKPT